MEKKKALKITKDNKLIPGTISRTILRSIVNNEILERKAYKDLLLEKQFKHLKKLYHEKKIELDKKGENYPKYLPFYMIIREKFPTVTWDIKYNSSSGKAVVDISLPRINNLRPSLLSLLLDKIDSQADSTLTRKYNCSYGLPKFVIKTLSNFLDKIDAIYPPEQEMQRIIDWFSLSLKGQKMTIFIPICPDYSVEPLTHSFYLFRHTFNSLGTGIGQIAQRIIDILPALYETLNELNINPEIVPGIADFEGFSAANLKRLNLTMDEFLNRVNLSRLAFSKKTKLRTFMITELFGGKSQWLACFKYIKKAFHNNHFGLTGITKDTLVKIVKKRKLLYKRWYGEKCSFDDYLSIALEQGIDYSVMGTFIAKKLKNCLVLGADNSVMAPFYSFIKPIPTLYLKRYYC